MKIILNNKEELFEGDQFTINDLLKAKRFTFKMLVIKVNNQLVKKMIIRDFQAVSIPCLPEHSI